MIKKTEYGNWNINDDIYDDDDILGLIMLQSIIISKRNIIFSIEECANIWHTYSNNLQASWLFFPVTPEEILSQIESDDYFISLEESAKC